ncbi:MAG: carbon storage regulator CsrA [Candidatus Pristimantibacillus lignocellulolyticus]|uniref:Translational regulator CsrA n=1 Tax=Candidatus Pristimantibacillus lignocellulolyticus TaxID=2994561 RepID=A0A9J6ZIY9_9BACL|nr:MAG: carbon storage regulator CsrA [Candidatus Pristimantibacillus lignocellulolyticus]
MLVLKRKVGEVVRVANDIEVHVLAVEGDTIKLGFEAPKHIQILRSEVYDAIKAENVQSAMSNDHDAKVMLKQLMKKSLNNDKS